MKVDFKKTLDAYSARHNIFRTLVVPPLTYLMLDGHGDPNTAPEYAEAIGALYPVAYALKFASKNDLERDYVVPPLEALWWAENMNSFTTERDKSEWNWTAMIMVPDWIDRPMFEAAAATAASKSNSDASSRVRLETLDEGLCVQTLHIGSYDDETSVLDELHHRYIPSSGLTMTGRHHEIYLSDPRRVEPAKLRTILRQPVAHSAESASL
ncbi:GyrI-like domain-containing protein [Rhodococcus sp. IEGM 1401]|uniref:GyrI-like domain-containing protein n=1 Tax=unclassified Rhodococcus (in: high G+C Gram-positive bacteria) TaxID=192944 RepID=UPI0022B48E45|nr:MULTISPECIES: GyrI-like domain-containing protein [unclassified Rhodococcus (in: high G+C Gram-positive bacteria)]MCZ4560177.1 GyrI-like domain-containing protein [Rhodococcus sp. IEGM 1401]MDI9920304.1 GyrI-like domain-containing protein [Rhodococcus sp. IEGM 1372]MDV8033010.1 GyrI-like domain-containing protein [Rhodococcus sp. IEGM 1414]